MDPSLRDGELTLFSRVGNEYAAGDVVVFKKDDELLVSRVFATAGQLVDADEDGYLTIDGAVQTDSAVIDVNDSSARQRAGLPFRVPTGAFYLLNDNYDSDEDSRSFGALYEKDLQGRVISTLKVRGI